MFLHLNGPCLYDFVPMLVWFRTHACMILYPCLHDFVPMLVWFLTHACMISCPCLCDFVLMPVWFFTHASVISYSCLYDFVLVLVWFRTHACMISYSCLYDLVLCHWKANRQLPFSPMITSTISKICRVNKSCFSPFIFPYFLHYVILFF